MSERSSHRYRYWSILAAQVVLLVLATFMEQNPVLYILFVICMFAVFGSVIHAIRKRRRPKVFAIICGAAAVIGGFLWAIPGIPIETIEGSLIVTAFAYAAFVFIAIHSIMRDVLISDRAVADRIVGSICAYLLIGMFFAFIYGGVALFLPGAFDLRGGTLHSLEDFRDYLYFSYTTLTTTGFGDMVATHPFTRLLAIFEALIGPLYLAVMVARLVGMHLNESKARHPSS